MFTQNLYFNGYQPFKHLYCHSGCSVLYRKKTAWQIFFQWMFTQLIHKFDLVWFSFKGKRKKYFYFLLESLEMVLS